MEQKEYTLDYKKEAIKLSKEVGATKTSKELGVPKATLYGWIKKEKDGEIDLGVGSRTPSNAMSLAAENKLLREKIKEYEKNIARIKKENEFLEEATRFFAKIRQK
jgi:transposase